MIAFAEHVFTLAKPGEDGVPLGAKLEFLGKLRDDGPELPAQVAHIWEWFQNLNQGRTSNGWSANPLSWGEIQAWAQLMWINLVPLEVRLLRALDEAWMRTIGAPSKETRDG